MTKVVQIYDERENRINKIHRALCAVIDAEIEAGGDLTIWELVGVLESMKHDILLSPRH